MGDDSAMYSPDVMVSANTCKPISQTDLDKDMPTFWCATCQVDMKRPVIAIQHLIGRDHCAKVKSGKSPKETTTTATKRKTDIGTVGYENIPVKKYKGPGPSSTSKSERKDWRKGSSSTSKSERKDWGKDWRKYSYRGGQGRGFGVQPSDRGLGRGLGRGYGRGFGGGYGSGYGGMGPQFPAMRPAPYPNNMPSGPHTSFAALESEVNFLRRQVSAFMGY